VYRSCQRELRIQVAIALAACVGCAVRPHALDYVVLPTDHEEQRQAPAVVEPKEADVPKDAVVPKDAAEPLTGTGGACGVGLIGSECERGLLEDETPLDQRTFLGPDGVVIENWEDLSLPSATRPTADRRPVRRAGRPRQ
jgi:hypothetical protein